MNRVESTFKTINLLQNSKDLIPVYLACVNKVLQEVAISIATIADVMKEERDEKKRIKLDSLLSVSEAIAFKEKLGIKSPSEETKKREEEVRENFNKGLEEGEK